MQKDLRFPKAESVLRNEIHFYDFRQCNLVEVQGCLTSQKKKKKKNTWVFTCKPKRVLNILHLIGITKELVEYSSSHRNLHVNLKVT